MTMISDQDFGSLQEQVKSIKETGDRLELRLFGDSDSPGMLILIADHSRSLSEHSKSIISLNSNLDSRMAEVLSGLESLRLTVEAQRFILEAHIHDKSQQPREWLIRHWKSVLSILVGIFLILHAVIPQNITIWEALKSL